jgi:phenylalanine-4-hydroxylase
VPALISDVEFYNLLSQKRFPATCFIRIPEELDYLEEPDIFHEFFGHLPLLTWAPYADFLERFALFFLLVEPQYQKFLARIFWFTIEF